MHLLAPAKINLHLRVGRRRDDGFHPLLSWMCTVGLFDSLTLEADADAATGAATAQAPLAETWRAGGRVTEDGADGDLVALEIHGDGDRPDLPRDGRNLVVRIASAFVQDLRRERERARERADPGAPPPPRPASREGGDRGTSVLPTARAAAEANERWAASAGAAPVRAPGTKEDPANHASSRVVEDQAAAGSSGKGAGAVRGAEGSGRSIRREGGERDDAGGAAQDRRAPDRAAQDHVAQDRAAQDRAAPDRVAPDGVAPDGAGPVAIAPVRIGLTKRVPIGAGLGGGSADAAYTLVGLDRLLSAGWAAEHLSDFAARFGSDVPFFVHAALGAPSSACRGRGEIVRPVARPKARWAVIFSPPFALCTRDVYARFDELGMGSDDALEPASEPDWAAWAQLPAQKLLDVLVNDLEPAAFSLCGDLARIRAELERRLGRTVRMSGSGSSLFTLYDVEERGEAWEAERVAASMGLTGVVVEVAP